MPYLKVRKFVNDKPILFGLNSNYSAPFSVSLADTEVRKDSDGYRSVPEGVFIVNVAGTTRVLPRTRLGAATATNSPLVTLKAPSFQFKVGDVLSSKAGYGKLVFSGTFAEGDVYTVLIEDTTYSVTAPANPTADNVVDAFITAHGADLLSEKGITATQVGTTGTITLVSTESYKVDTASSSAVAGVKLESTEAGYLGDNILPLGTIASIADPNNAEQRVVTLAANAAYVLPTNTPVGVNVSKYLGIYPHHLDLLEDPIVHIAPITKADGVYEANLPYIDAQLKRIFRDLNINKYFYKA